VVEDVSGDGKPDILVGNYCPNNNCAAGHGSLGVLLGNGDGSFQPALTYNPVRGAVISIAVADLNGDGKLDVVVASPIGVFLGNGNGTFQAATAVNATHYPNQVFVADLNHDGRLDLVGINGTIGSADVYLRNADGTYQQPQNYKLGGSYSSWATLADIDKDGKPDLVAANWCCQPLKSYEGTVGVLLNIFKDNTETTFTSSLNPSIYGQRVTWTAKVTTSGLTHPTGNVAFRWSRDGQNYTIGVAPLNAAGIATVIRPGLNANPFGAPYPLFAAYVGDTFNAGSTSTTLNQSITQAVTTASLTSSQNPSKSGQEVTFAANITSPTVIPTGPVTFSVGTTVLGTVQLWGTGCAKFTTSSLPVGSNRVKVTFNGNSNVATTSASLVQTVR
jgi:hypothetical protein